MTKGEFRVFGFVLAGLIEEAVILFRHDPAWQGRVGCYFCMGDRQGGESLFGPMLVGEVPPEKAGRYLRLSKEKYHRLVLHPCHHSSYESRDRAADKWGGAVSLGIREPIFSISGFSEYGDEALSLLLAEIHGARMAPVSAAGVAGIIAMRTGNPYWEPLRDAARMIMDVAMQAA
ncbi:MAG: hypothetical protein P4L67_03140 [Candidatus Pacebacteria bacterium]|nr:hypothetical protein [Candidatus Paceibacterota bacterium]